MANDTRTLRVVVTGDSTGGQKALENVGKSAQHTESRIGNLAKGMGAFALKGGGALLTVAGAAGALGLKTASGFQQAQVGFTTMLGSGKKADAFLHDLEKFAANTPFAFPDLVMASQRMLAMGFAAKDVKPTLTAVGDAVAAMGGGKEQIDQVTMALGQMQAKGKVQGDELLQLTEAGIPALKILAAQYGVNVGEMQKMISKGKVLSSDAIPKLVQGIEKGTKSTKAFGGMMANQSKTLVGQWSNLKDTVTTGLGKVIAPFLPMITQGTGGLNKFLQGPLTKLANYTKNVAAPAIQKFVKDWKGLTEGTFGGEARQKIMAIADAIRNFKKDWDGLIKGTFGGDAKAKILGVANAIKGFFTGSKGADGAQVKESLKSMRESFEKLGPIVQQLKDDIPSFGDTLRVTAQAMKWLADHSDELKAALPYLAAGFILVKTAQVGANVAAALSPAIRIAEVIATRKLTASQIQLAAAMRTGTAATVTANVAENVSIFTRIKNTAAMVAQKVATVAVSVATKAWAAAQWLINAAMTANPIGLAVAAIAALVAAVIYAWKNFGWFRTAVTAAWNAIKASTQVVASWFMTYVWPVYRTFFGYIKTAVMFVVGIWKTQFNFMRSVVMAVVGYFRNTAWPILQTAFGLIKDAVLKLWNSFKTHFDNIKYKVQLVMEAAKIAFKKAKDDIGATWAKLQDLAKKPVNFVIETVYNNGIRKFWNAIATKVGAKPLDTIPKLAGGGRGIPSRSDVVGDWVPFFGQAGEYVMNRKQVAMAGGWRGIEEMFGKAGRGGASGGHYDRGGILGGLANAGSWLKDKGTQLVKGSLLKVAEPLINSIKDGIKMIPGSGDIADAVRGLPTKLLDQILAWVKPKDKAAIGDMTGPGGWQWMVKAIHKVFPSLGIMSTLRVGATTLSGNQSYHALGRAIDTEPLREAAEWIMATYGKATKELITPWRSLMLKNGRHHKFSRDVEAQHGVFGNNRHIHWAYDDGGILPPGNTLAVNNTGRNEYVFTAEQLRRNAPSVVVNVTVQGNVTAEKDLAERIATEVRDALIRKANRNGGRSGLK